jgi:uncharacterized membrane protein YeaQ/YmgE (transglycosylase-associated protein family)
MDLVSLIVWLVIGGVIGWLASIIMKTDAQQGILLNVVVGIVGSYVGGWLFTRYLLSLGTAAPYVSALLGAIVLLAVINLLRRGRVR